MKINFGLQDILLVSPVLTLLVTGMLPLVIKIFRDNKEQPIEATVYQCLAGIATAAGLVFVFAGNGVTAFSDALVFDRFSMLMGLVILVLAAGSLLLLSNNPNTRGEQFSEMVFLFLGSVIGMFVMIWSNDLLTLFIGLETMSLPLYLMIGMSHEQKNAKEASLKYFVLGSFASAIFLYGMAMIFGAVGSLYFGDIAQVAAEFSSVNRLFLLGLVFLIIGFCFKVSIFPFHAWAPDVYQGAPTPLTAFMATAVKVVSFVAFLRVITTQALIGSQDMVDVLQWLAVLTILVGNVAAILQDNFKRMLAYSSVAHSGYILIGIITAGISGNWVLGASGVVFYLISYSLMTLGAFAVICLFEKETSSSVSVTDLRGLAFKHPWYALALTVFMLSLAGIPPTVGFFGKFYMFTAALGEGLVWLVTWGMIGSVISVYYYLRPTVLMYMNEGPPISMASPLSYTKLIVWSTVFLVVVVGLISSPVYFFIENAISR